jgi:hypothetical protein
MESCPFYDLTNSARLYYVLGLKPKMGRVVLTYVAQPDMCIRPVPKKFSFCFILSDSVGLNQISRLPIKTPKQHHSAFAAATALSTLTAASSAVCSQFVAFAPAFRLPQELLLDVMQACSFCSAPHAPRPTSSRFGLTFCSCFFHYRAAALVPPTSVAAAVGFFSC